MNDFITITAYKCKKCGAVVEITAGHSCNVSNSAACAPSTPSSRMEYPNPAAAAGGNP